MSTAVTGFLRKSSGDKKGFRKRFFALKGFHIYYYADDPSHGGTVRGHFDLRNVVQISEVDHGIAPNAVQLCIAEGEASRVKKTIILSFDTEPMKRDVWLDAMCSAISSAFVDPGLRHHHVLPLASEFNFRFGQQRGVGSRRSLLSLSAPVTTPLTPRDAAPQSNPSPSTAPLAYEIVVPEGAAPGDKLKMKLPSGGEVLVTIPADAMPLSILTFVMPNAIGDDKAAGIIQTRARGYLVRRHITSTEHEGSDDVDAAVLIQAAVRGKLARRRMSAAAAAPMQDGPASDDTLASPGMLGRLKSYVWSSAAGSEKTRVSNLETRAGPRELPAGALASSAPDLHGDLDAEGQPQPNGRCTVS